MDDAKARHQGYVDSGLKADAPLLAFYATQEHWQSPSTDFVRRSNPHPSAVDRDGGQRAYSALSEPLAAAARQ